LPTLPVTPIGVKKKLGARSCHFVTQLQTSDREDYGWSEFQPCPYIRPKWQILSDIK